MNSKYSFLTSFLLASGIFFIVSLSLNFDSVYSQEEVESSPTLSEQSSSSAPSSTIETQYSVLGVDKEIFEDDSKAVRDGILKLVTESVEKILGKNSTHLAQTVFINEQTNSKQELTGIEDLKTLIELQLEKNIETSIANNNLKGLTLFNVDTSCDSFSNPTPESCKFTFTLKK